MIDRRIEDECRTCGQKLCEQDDGYRYCPSEGLVGHARSFHREQMNDPQGPVQTVVAALMERIKKLEEDEATADQIIEALTNEVDALESQLARFQDGASDE